MIRYVDRYLNVPLQPSQSQTTPNHSNTSLGQALGMISHSNTGSQINEFFAKRHQAYKSTKTSNTEQEDTLSQVSSISIRSEASSGVSNTDESEEYCGAIYHVMDGMNETIINDSKITSNSCSLSRIQTSRHRRDIITSKNKLVLTKSNEKWHVKMRSCYYSSETTTSHSYQLDKNRKIEVSSGFKNSSASRDVRDGEVRSIQSITDQEINDGLPDI